ncbi:BspA family leucine-rich repeat surface protein [Lactococcus lactis]|nr:BspA family leucine-rich repeat surface protein [Lactococcus lactis]
MIPYKATLVLTHQIHLIKKEIMYNKKITSYILIGTGVCLSAVLLLTGMSQKNNTPDKPKTIQSSTKNKIISGKFGTSKWTLNENGTLTIEAGEFSNYSMEDRSDWFTHYSENIKKIVFTGPVKAAENSSYLFAGLTKLTAIDNLRQLDTRNVTNMSHMFSNTSLTSLDLNNFDTSNVTDMSGMFRKTPLTSLDLNNFDTSNVTDMSDMFDHSQITSLDLSSFNTSNVTNMSDMFSDTALTSLDLNNFDTSSVTTMSSMFFSTKSLTSLDVSNFNTSNVADMSNLFNSSNLSSIDLENWSTISVNNMLGMFDNDSSLNELTIGDNFELSDDANLPEGVSIYK